MSALSGDEPCKVRVIGFKLEYASVTLLGDSITIVVNAGFGAVVVVAIVSVTADDAEVTKTEEVCGVECSVAISGCLMDIVGSDWNIGCGCCR